MGRGKRCLLHAVVYLLLEGLQPCGEVAVRTLQFPADAGDLVEYVLARLLMPDHPRGAYEFCKPIEEHDESVEVARPFPESWHFDRDPPHHLPMAQVWDLLNEGELDEHGIGVEEGQHLGLIIPC